MRYALIENGLVVEVKQMADNFNPSAVTHKFDFRLVNVLLDPAFDSSIEELKGWTYTINPNSVDAQRVVVALSQEEMDENAQDEIDRTERNQARAAYQNLIDGVGTNAERLVRVERITARLLRDRYGV